MHQKISQIRRLNLEILITEAGSAKELARRADSSSAYLSQVRHRTRTGQGTPRSIGDALAGRLEAAMGKSPGWMDTPRAAPNTHAGPDTGTLCPLVSWVQAGPWREIAEGGLDEAEWLPCPVRCSPASFVLRVHGASMEPRFRDGDLVFVDPEVPADHGRFVVVRLDGSNEATFKQLIVEQGRRYLKALNPDWPGRIIPLDEDATLCGVIVFKGEAV